ncbi:MAG TPA: ABC transporter permease [Planctomycetota bacterium]|nr:ABC transporter permease [Planctomycetota bacterium]
MTPWTTLRLALRSLRRNRVRTGLTMLGIVIGIASVIAMVGIGEGASTMIQDQIRSMGRNLLMVLPGAASSGGFSWGAGSVATLTPEDGAALAKELPSIRAVAPIVRTRAQLVYGDRNWVPVSVMGTGIEFVDVRDWPLEEGAFFTDADVASASRVCVLGRTVAESLFLGESPLGKVLRIKNMPFRVAGVLSPKGTNAMGQDQDDVVLGPWTTVKKVLQGSAFNNVDQLLVTVASAPAIPLATDDLTGLLRQRHHIRDGEESDFRVLTMAEMAATVTQTSHVMTLLLALIASISLLVGGIGIMNIMLVSVVERTREIGLRAAVGARSRDIRRQFLFEAVVLSTAAGVFGIALGTAGAAVLSRTLHWPTRIAPGSIGMAFLFSCAVGVFFGFYPAMRASRLDPIVALRYE